MPTTHRSGPRSASGLDILGDIGGTNARFAIVENNQPAHIMTLPCADYPGPAEALGAYLDRNGLKVSPGSRAAIGIANPLDGDLIQMTNHSWRFSIEAMRQQLGLAELHFLNDFKALALSLPSLHDADRLQVGGGAAQAGCAIGVIGPGTGLGVSGLLPKGKGHIAIEGEGGHATLSGQTQEELDVIAALIKQYPHVSAERVICGPGLGLLYRTLASVRGVQVSPQDAPQITARAISGEDGLCVDCVNMFCALLGTQAANLALTLGARGGIYIGGGIVPQLAALPGGFFQRSPFRQRFEDKGRFSTYLAAIPTWIITAPYPALLGAAAFLEAE